MAWFRPLLPQCGRRRLRNVRFRICDSLQDGCSGIPDRSAFCRNDTAFDHDICRAADHDQVLDIVTPHENEASPRIDSGCVENGEARLAVAPATDKR